MLAAALLLPLCVNAGNAAADAAFDRFLQSLWPEAERAGVSRGVFDNAVRGLEPDLSLPDLVIAGRPEKAPGQAEFVQMPSDYLKESALARLAERGRVLAVQHRDVLARIEKQFGVPGPVVLAIWGRETAYGTYKVPNDAIRVLATQAYTGRRKDMFRKEFIGALKMLQDGTPREVMRSSWGGAMGLTQFLPTEYFKYAVDFDGSGRADIFTSVPDALASAAKQLRGKGWQPGIGWAIEVRVPAGIDCTIAEPERRQPLREWFRQGYVPVDGAKPAAAQMNEEASLLMPEGIYGPGFLTLRNYYVIKDYNFADLYVLFVGNLADRIAGGKPFQTPWAKLEPMRSERVEEMQRILVRHGLYSNAIDGKAGMKTRSALGQYQKKAGLRQDCWPSNELWRAMTAR